MREPPQTEPKEVLAYRSEARRVLADADPTRMEQLLRLWVKEVRREPERHPVHIWYRVPYLQNVVAGAGFEADSERVPVVSVLWTYAGARQGERQMQRVGPARH